MRYNFTHNLLTKEEQIMTKWDTIQADVSDMYIGLEESLAWEKAIEDGDVSFAKYNEDELTLDWND